MYTDRMTGMQTNRRGRITVALAEVKNSEESVNFNTVLSKLSYIYHQRRSWRLEYDDRMMTTNYQKNNKILYLLFANISARRLRYGDGIAVFSWYQVYDEKYIFFS